ncbi:MAG TPA: preprotein translocase subunit SecG [Candidatus Pacearchaeota archaeon]|nr:preprotein translocase subunit SecG [Candidatus Paceibacterota bacterium]HOK00492.1 preprotein translocase subunit SecG [Candidatus Pacearchaeota archaeon]HOL90281.1 preprotein translocase subunit SecG [Candidatus Pacearchaeota archaeon]HOW12919.1 preprotein translocase subunit SecG [Candidatus Pacearchaeota archaeon]HPO68486.1 preprotein translocase subunit SecG [Candidatus Pacearchaeota archaeon]
MENLLPILQIIVSILLIVFILLQQRGTALGSTFGGEENVYSSRRGLEKKIFWATVIFTALFIILAVVNLLLSNV